MEIRIVVLIYGILYFKKNVLVKSFEKCKKSVRHFTKCLYEQININTQLLQIQFEQTIHRLSNYKLFSLVKEH